MSEFTDDATDAARLIVLGMRPKQVPRRDLDYADLVRRYANDEDFADLVRAVANGFDLIVLDVNERSGMVLGPRADSIFIVRIDEYARRSTLSGRGWFPVPKTGAGRACEPIWRGPTIRSLPLPPRWRGWAISGIFWPRSLTKRQPMPRATQGGNDRTADRLAGMDCRAGSPDRAEACAGEAGAGIGNGDTQ